MITSDAAKRQLDATSNFRQRPVLEWSKQISRSTQPFFLANAPPNIRQNYGTEAPRHHFPRILFDKTPSRDSGDTAPDGRDYHPSTYDDLHPHCAVDIKRGLPRKDIFTKSGGADGMLDPFQYPGWGHGKQSSLPRAAKTSWLAASTTYDYSDALNVDTTAVGHQAPSVVFGKAARATSVSKKDDRPALDVSTSAVSRHSSTMSIGQCSTRTKLPKPSENYRTLLLPDTQPLGQSSKARITQGFAPVRHNHRLTLGDLLGQTAADAKRARSVMETYFGDRSMSSLRSSYLYTPQPGDGRSHSSIH